ncbi:SHOCT domain-containing protein [Halobellus sp. GM3]|uniref:SHOCT domain-containing protein n=1 Tax=Halobellus sp. GM3 TaxID=3458410 RepID=UPI00403D6C01
MPERDAIQWLVGALVVLGVLLLAGPLLFGMSGGAWAGGMWGPMYDGGMWRPMYDGGMWGPMHDGGGGGTVWWVVVLLWRLLLLVTLVGGGYVLYRAASGDRGETADRRDPAMEELRGAYARGDISEEEYERRRERLRRE